MKSEVRNVQIAAESADMVDISLSPSSQSSSDFQSASDSFEKPESLGNQEITFDAVDQVASWQLSSVVESTSSSVSTRADLCKHELPVSTSLFSPSLKTDVDREFSVKSEDDVLANSACTPLTAKISDESEKPANEREKLANEREFFLSNLDAIGDTQPSKCCEINEKEFPNQTPLTANYKLHDKKKNFSTEETSIFENAQDYQSRYPSMSKGSCSNQLCIPLILLTMNPTPDMLESYRYFHEIAHNLIVVCDIAPHLSLIGDIRLLRFLIGYRMNAILASEAFRKHLQWLKHVNGDTIIRKYIEKEMLDQLQPENAPNHDKISRHFPINYLLRDESGNPILDKQGNIITIERPGFLDEKRLSAELNDAEILLWHIYQLEFRSMLLDRMSQEQNMMVKATIIIDLAGFSTRSVNRQLMNLLRQSIFLASENYPETMSYIFFVNTPKVFYTVWNVLKGWLNERTLSKIHILNCMYEDILFRYVDKNNLPKFLGGSALSPLASVPLCGLLSNDRFGLGSNKQTLVISARKKEQLYFQLFSGMQLSWAWALQDQDIGFSVKVVRAISNQNTIKKDNEEAIVEFQRYDSSRTIRGHVSASTNSTIIFTWDNSWGLFSPRIIYYEIVQIVEADQRLSLDV